MFTVLPVIPTAGHDEGLDSCQITSFKFNTLGARVCLAAVCVHVFPDSKAHQDHASIRLGDMRHKSCCSTGRDFSRPY